jgi:hypothetical protein
VKKKFSPLFYNWLTYFGVWLAFFVFLIEVFLFIIDFFAHGHNLYLGLLTYLILPPFLVVGLMLIPAGALIKRYRVHRGLTQMEPKPLVINPSITTHRNAIFVFMTSTFILIVMSLVGAYKAFHFTESVQFCGLLCHQVMRPEFTAYSKSPHGRVKCVECHIGAGADWYVRSKISGGRQVLRVLTNSYEKPIHTPVQSLRPAEETCKQCHFPGKYFSTMDFRRSYFSEGEDNARWEMRMLLNVGAGEKQGYGVHAHMNVDHDISYAAEDTRRQKITWVKSVDKEGRENVYTAPGSKYEKKPPLPGEIRQMDCIDCHNRPTHQFLAPYRLVNESLTEGRLDAALPFIKKKSMELLSKNYASQKDGMDSIRKEFADFYRKEHSEVFAEKSQSIERSADYLAGLYSKNMFPEMKVRWDTHPDNIGHLVSDGCFRCHDGEHRSLEGKVISRDCKSCHTLVEQGPAGQTEKNLDGLEFKHPDGSEDWKETNCTICHS